MRVKHLTSWRKALNTNGQGRISISSSFIWKTALLDWKVRIFLALFLSAEWHGSWMVQGCLSDVRVLTTPFQRIIRYGLKGLSLCVQLHLHCFPFVYTCCFKYMNLCSEAYTDFWSKISKRYVCLKINISLQIHNEFTDFCKFPH